MLIEKALKKSKLEREKTSQTLTQKQPQPEPGTGREETARPKERLQASAAPRLRSRSLELDQCSIEGHRCLSEASGPEEIESYKILRTRLHHHMQSDGMKTLMVTSPCAGDGKTLTAINLAFSFAKFYHQTVLLVDCDLRRQNIHKSLGYADSPNLIDHLLDHVPLSDTMVRVGDEKLVVISGPRTLEGSAELLGSPQMMDLVDEVKNRYQDRIIIFDLPPILFTADAMAFEPLVDGILIVVAFGKTSMKDVQKAVDGLPREKILGFALNRSRISTNGYYNYHYDPSGQVNGEGK